MSSPTFPTPTRALALQFPPAGPALPLGCSPGTPPVRALGPGPAWRGAFPRSARARGEPEGRPLQTAASVPGGTVGLRRVYLFFFFLTKYFAAVFPLGMFVGNPAGGTLR